MGPRWGKINLSTDSGCSAAENSVGCCEIIFPHLLHIEQLEKEPEMAKIKRPEGGFPSHPRGRLSTMTGATGPATSISALAATSAPRPPFSKLQLHPVFLAAYLGDDKAKQSSMLATIGGLLRSTRPPAGPLSYIRPKGC